MNDGVGDKKTKNTSTLSLSSRDQKESFVCMLYPALPFIFFLFIPVPSQPQRVHHSVYHQQAF